MWSISQFMDDTARAKSRSPQPLRLRLPCPREEWEAVLQQLQREAR